MPTFIIEAIAAVGAFIGGLGAVGTFVLRVAAGFGLSLLAQAIAGKKDAPSAAGPGFSVEGTLQASGVVPRSFMLGLGATAGSLAYANSWGHDGDTPNAYFTQVIALADLPSQQLSNVWVNGVLATLLPDDADIDKGIPVQEYRKSGKDHLWIKFYDGTQTAADSFLVNVVASTDRPYASTRKGIGITYAACTSLVDDTLFTGFPQFMFELIGAKLYDVTQDTTAGGSGTQLWSDPSTWGGDGDHLTGVQLYNLLRGVSYGGRWLYGLQNLSAARLPNAHWIAQIGKCRATVTGPDGDEPTYRSGGEIKVANEIGSTIEQLLTACGGRMAESGGTYKPLIGAPGDAVASISDGDILSTEEQSFTPFLGLHDTINGVTANYPSPDEGWAIKAAPPLLNADFETLDGNRRLLADVDLNFVPYDRQVQHLMQSALDEARRARRHTFSLPPEYFVLEPGDTLDFTSVRNGYDSKLFRVDGVVDRANLDVVVDFTEVDPADYDWDQETDWTPPSVRSLAFIRPPAQAIVDWSASATAIFDDNDIARKPAILLEWDGDQEDIEGIEFEVRLQSSGEVVLRGRTENYAAAALIISQGLLASTQYEARGRYIPASSRLTTFSDWLSVTTLDVRISPLDIDNTLTALLQRINERIPDDLLTLRRDLDALSQALGDQITTMRAVTGRINIGVGSRYQQNQAGIELAQTAITGLDNALAALFVDLFAITEDGTATGLIRFVASSAPDGVAASFAIEIRASTSDAFAFSGFYMDAGVDELGGASRIRMRAGAIYAENTDTGSILNLLATTINDTPPTVAISSGTLTVDLTDRQAQFKSSITSACEIQYPTGAKPGMGWIHVLEQDGTGHAVTFDSDFYLDPHPTVSAIASTITILEGFIFDTAAAGPKAIMTALGGGTTNPALLGFYNMLQGAGVTSGLLSCLDAGHSDSWDSAVSSTSWRDLSGTARNLQLASSSNKPTFNGTIGNLSNGEYFSSDGNDEFDWSTDTVWDAFHKANAAYTFVDILHVPTSASANASCLFNSSINLADATFHTGLNYSIQRDVSSNLQLVIIVTNGSTVVLNANSTNRGSLTGKTIFVAASVNAASPTNGCILRMNALNDISNATYTLPSSGGRFVTQPQVMRYFSSFDITGLRMKARAVWSRALSSAELDAIYTRVAQTGRWPDIT